MARDCVAEWPSVATKLAEAFWPGPLTLVLPKSAKVPDIVTAGGETVALRWPSHRFIQEVIARCGFPLAAPSANQSGQISPTTAEHVRQSLGDRVSLIVDAGEASVGIESTVLDVTVRPPRILRPGMIHSESLAAVVGEVASNSSGEDEALRSPGLLLSITLQSEACDLDRREARPGRVHRRKGPVHLLCRTPLPAGVHADRIAVMPRDPEPFARALYAELHRCDEAGAAVIGVEGVPDGPEWAGIADRLRRAAAA